MRGVSSSVSRENRLYLSHIGCPFSPKFRAYMHITENLFPWRILHEDPSIRQRSCVRYERSRRTWKEGGEPIIHNFGVSRNWRKRKRRRRQRQSVSRTRSPRFTPRSSRSVISPLTAGISIQFGSATGDSSDKLSCALLNPDRFALRLRLMLKCAPRL